MFGYLQVDKGELKVREYEAYKSVYCGLCKQMGRDYSFLSRFSLSYDCAFYAMLLMSVRRSCSGFKDGRCVFNPLKKCKYAKTDDDCYSLAAAFSVISAYYKLKDDIADSGFFKKTAARLLLLFFGHWRKKAAKRYCEIDTVTAEMIKLQLETERKQAPSIDESAHPTANALGKIFAIEAKTEAERRVFYEFGYHIGRWIYLIDAADDLDDDIKSGSFNPFKAFAEGDSAREHIKFALSSSLARAYEAYNLIDIKDFKGILDNMMLYGFPAVQNRTLNKKPKQEVENDKSV